jgi:hypothetical protein
VRPGTWSGASTSADSSEHRHWKQHCCYGTNYLACQFVVGGLARFTEKFNRLTQAKNEAKTTLQSAINADAVSKKRALSVAPSSLTLDNLHLKIHDRDSGVARHAAFLAVLQSFNKTGWDEKKRLLIENCPDFFEESASIEVVETAANIDSDVEKLWTNIWAAAETNQRSWSGSLESQEPTKAQRKGCSLPTLRPCF